MPVTRADAESKPSLRLDARRNLEKLKVAAMEVFQEHGLGIPLEEIAQRAGVSTGTLYNRFGSREVLIDEVMADVAAARLGAVVKRARDCADPWERFALYVEQICELQAADPALNDVVSRKFPQARKLAAVCEESLKHARRFIKEAQRQGSLRADFTAEDLYFLLLSNAGLVRATVDSAPDAWRRVVGFVLDGLHAEAARMLPVGTRQQEV